MWLPYVLGVIFILVFIFLIQHNVRIKVTVGLLLCFIFGVLRFVLALPTNTPDQIQTYAGKQVAIEGVIREDPDRRLSGAQYVIKVDRFTNQPEVLNGRLLIKTPLYPEYAYGDRLRISCRILQTEPAKDGFRYDKYLANQGIFATCNQPKIEKISVGNGSWVYSQILRFKYFIADRIDRLWSEPESSFMAGILYGSRAGLPPDITDAFNKTGVTHIIAVSGSNISIIAVSVMTLCLACGLHRRYAWWLVSGLIIMFVIFTGASASVVRAGIMGIIALVAKQVGRPVRMSIVLMVTAVGMTLANPYVLMWDAGFQLSFLATLGLIYINPILVRFVPLHRCPKVIGVLGENGLTTISAILATLPLMLYQFGRLSLVAPIVNVLILWTIPYVMLVGFVATVGGILFVPLGQILAFPGVILMEYILRIVKFFGTLSFAALSFQLPFVGMVVLYAALVYGVWRFSRLISNA